MLKRSRSIGLTNVLQKKVYNDARHHQIKLEPWIGNVEMPSRPGIGNVKMPTLYLWMTYWMVYIPTHSSSDNWKAHVHMRPTPDTGFQQVRFQLSTRVMGTDRSQKEDWHDTIEGTAFQHIWNERRALRERIVLLKETFLHLDETFKISGNISSLIDAMWPRWISYSRHFCWWRPIMVVYRSTTFDIVCARAAGANLAGWDGSYHSICLAPWT